MIGSKRQPSASAALASIVFGLLPALVPVRADSAPSKPFQANEVPLAGAGGLTGGQGTLDGWTYRYRSDGRGSLVNGTGQQWTIDCKTDKITDDRGCSLSQEQGQLFLFYSRPEGVPGLCIVGHDYPGKAAFARVDKAPAWEIPPANKGCVILAADQHKALLAGKTLTTRRVHWPQPVAIDETSSLAGLSKAESLLRFIYVMK